MQLIYYLFPNIQNDKEYVLKDFYLISILILLEVKYTLIN